MVGIIKQQSWTEEAFLADEFSLYEPQKRLTMARKLQAAEAPLQIVTPSGEKLTAHAGMMICYDPDNHVRATLDDYEHWPVEEDIFHMTYEVWNVWDWTPTAAEKRLMKLGCKPYYKIATVWAKKLYKSVYLQSREQKTPELVKAGRYVVIGVKGDPYSMSESAFNRRYRKRDLVPLWAYIQQLFNTEV
jgi:hypothetical protein